MVHLCINSGSHIFTILNLVARRKLYLIIHFISSISVVTFSLGKKKKNFSPTDIQVFDVLLSLTLSLNSNSNRAALECKNFHRPVSLHLNIKKKKKTCQGPHEQISAEESTEFLKEK